MTCSTGPQADPPTEEAARHVGFGFGLGGAVRAYRTMATWVRRSPLTSAYIAILLLSHWTLDHWLSRAATSQVESYVSTNLDNLGRHPVPSLLCSAFILDGSLLRVTTLSFVGILITFVVGIVVVLSQLERRIGPLRAYAVLAVGHLGATLITALFIAIATAHRWYPESVRTAGDFGISYGTQAVMACATFILIPRRYRFVWIAFVLVWPFGGVQWFGWVPDFTTVGHLIAAAIGFGLGAALRNTGRSEDYRRSRTDQSA